MFHFLVVLALGSDVFCAGLVSNIIRLVQPEGEGGIACACVCVCDQFVKVKGVGCLVVVHFNKDKFFYSVW